jgi:nitroreductase/RimJ/RimL family protein N-acetyltransferase
MIYPLYHRVEDVRTWLESRNADDPDNYDEGIVLKSTGELIGSGGMHYHAERNAWEIGYNIRADQWGNGYVVEYLKALIEQIRKVRAVDAIDGVFAAENHKSQRVMEKLGMHYFMDTTFTKLDGSETFPAKYYRRDFPAAEKADVLGAISERRSYRGKYLPVQVPRENLRIIMQAGLDAPSGCNKQTTSLIGVDDSEILKKLKAVIHPPVAETAPAMICVLTQRINAYRDRCFAVQDYSAAIENMLLAAEKLGYRSCWYEGHITDADRIGDRMAEILNVPEGYELVCMLPIGVPADKPSAPKKKVFGERAWFNSFGSDTENGK